LRRRPRLTNPTKGPSPQHLKPLEEYLKNPDSLPTKDTARWFVLSRMRERVKNYSFPEVAPEVLNNFLMTLPQEHRFSLFVDLVYRWGDLGADPALLDTLTELTGP